MTGSAAPLPNKGSFSLATSIVGWDLDHTLARYSLKALSAHIVFCFTQFIVNQAGYSPKLLDLALKSLEDGGGQQAAIFSTKGVVFDKLLGNFLWIDQDKKVTRSYHGTRLILQEGQVGAAEVADEEAALQLTHIYPGPIDEFDAKAKEFHPRDRFHSFLTGFDFPILHLLACIVDLLDEGTAKEGGNQAQLPNDSLEHPFESPYADAFMDLVRGFEYNFGHFTQKSGYYFPMLREDPSRFVYNRANVREWIMRLREHHVPLFLVTNADYGYCNLLMNVTYGKDWRTLFDLVVVSAKKPRFFSEQHPFLEVNLDTMLEGAPVSEIECGKVYSQGNATALAALMATKVKADKVAAGKQPRVVYFGDNLLTDVMAIKLHQNWLPVAITEEMEQHVIPEGLEKRGTKRQANGTAVTPVEGNDNHHRLEKQTPSETWGSFFFTETDRLSYWARFIELHSALCISDLEVLTNVPIDHPFEYEFGTNQCYYPKLVNNHHTN